MVLVNKPYIELTVSKTRNIVASNMHDIEINEHYFAYLLVAGSSKHNYVANFNL